jgi:hypothetical protein
MGVKMKSTMSPTKERTSPATGNAVLTTFIPIVTNLSMMPPMAEEAAEPGM